jgi:hypothetical protein
VRQRDRDCVGDLREPAVPIGFDVDDIDAVHEKLKADWKFFSPHVLVEAMNIKTVYFLGPENIVIKLTQSLGTTHGE